METFNTPENFKESQDSILKESLQDLTKYHEDLLLKEAELSKIIFILEEEFKKLIEPQKENNFQQIEICVTLLRQSDKLLQETRYRIEKNKLEMSIIQMIIEEKYCGVILSDTIKKLEK